MWDCAALPDDAAFLVKHDLPAMLPPLLTAAAAAERWRALEIALGTLGNLACHAGTKQLLLGQAGLPQLLLDTLLWVDDAASLAELCRCLTSLLADSSRQVRRWVLLRRVGHALLPLCQSVCKQLFGWSLIVPADTQRPGLRLAPCLHGMSFQLPAAPRPHPRRRLPRHGGRCCFERRLWAGWCGLWRTR